jgi:protein involved in polysaccharide export with SLBB domain
MSVIPGDSFILYVQNALGDSEYISEKIVIDEMQTFFLPRLGRVQTANLTVNGLRIELEKLAEKNLYLKNPDINLDYHKMIEVWVFNDRTMQGKKLVNFNSTIADILNNMDERPINLRRGGTVHKLYPYKKAADRQFVLQHGDIIEADVHIEIELIMGNNYQGKKSMPEGSKVSELPFPDTATQGTEQYDFRQIHLRRGTELLKLNVIDSETDRNFLLADGDLVEIKYLSETTGNHYILAGNFTRPGRYFMARKTTLMDILASGNGALNKREYVRTFYIIRQKPEAEKDPEIIEVNARSLLKMGEIKYDVEIQRNDIILASVERKVHIMNKIRNSLQEYVSFDAFIRSVENLRIFN